MTSLRLFLFAVLALLCAGCSHDPYARRARFSLVRVTDPRGLLIADWVAVGYVRRTETGYSFEAVERQTGGPYPAYVRYPHGRRVEASGPNIIVSPCAPPAWLQTYTTRTTTTVVRRDYK